MIAVRRRRERTAREKCAARFHAAFGLRARHARSGQRKSQERTSRCDRVAFRPVSKSMANRRRARVQDARRPGAACERCHRARRNVQGCRATPRVQSRPRGRRAPARPSRRLKTKSCDSASLRSGQALEPLLCFFAFAEDRVEFDGFDAGRDAQGNRLDAHRQNFARVMNLEHVAGFHIVARFERASALIEDATRIERFFGLGAALCEPCDLEELIEAQRLR